MKPQNFIIAGLTLALLSILNLQLSRCHAAPGDLDPSFAGTGKSLIGFGGGLQHCYSAAVQSDGKLVLAGADDTGFVYEEFEVVRLDTNNVLDASFGTGGAVFTPFNPTSSFAYGASADVVKIQADGKIIAAGWADRTGTYSDFALARYNPDGSLDSSFGAGGKVVTDFGVYSGITAMTILADGRILVAGSAGTNFALARYESNGVLDTSFGNGGVVTTDVGGGFAVNGAAALLVQGGGYVAAGTGLNGNDIAVLRYTTNGVLDTTFGGTGKVLTPIPGYLAVSAEAVGFQFGNGTVVDPGNIVVSGQATSDLTANRVFVIVRYNLDGTLDTTFGGTGIVTGTFTAGDEYSDAAAVLVQGQFLHPRKITVAGTGSDASATYFGMARYNADGTLDTTFGPGGTGKATLSFGPAKDDEANTMVYDFGRFVLAGWSSRSTISDHSDFAAARFNSDGSLDTTFGNQGVVTADVCGSSWARAVAIQPDGKAVVAGQDYNGQELFALARYNPDGTVDSSFGVGGRVTTKVGSTNAAAYAVAVQPDGKIVAAGYSWTGFETYQEFAAVRYNANGSLDPSFGSAGQVITPVGGRKDAANAIALQPDGKIVVAGSSFNLVNDDFAVVRYATNGALDSTFGGAGKVTTSLGGESVANAVRIQADGKIVVAGYAYVGPSTNFALARFNADGSLDNSFGSFGKVTTDFGSGNPAYGYGLALQPDGKMIVAGGVRMGGIGYVALARYATNGALDPSFGTGGKVITQVGFISDQANAVAVLPDGKIVVAGESEQDTFSDYAILRYNPDGSLDSSYGIGGKQIVSFEDGDDFGMALALDQIGRAVVAGYATGLFGVVRLTSEPFLKITSLTQVENGITLLTGLGVPEANHTLYDSPDLTPGTFSPLDSVTPDAGGFWQYEDTNAVGLDRRFYRLSYP